MNALTRRVRAPLILVTLGVALAGLARPACGQAPASAPPVTVETRAIPGRDVKQVTAHGVVDAPPHVVRAVIADIGRYSAFIPYVKDSRILSRDAEGAVLNYQRLSFGLPFVGDRHYVIRVAERRYRGTDGRLSYAFIWRLEDGLPDGVDPDAVRVSVNSGYWDLRPAKDSDGSTDVRYCVFTDPAGALPKWLVGMANTDAIPKLFAAVASEARSPRYATLAPPPEGGATTERLTLGGCADTTSSALC